jgi:hypothetical protein
VNVSRTFGWRFVEAVPAWLFVLLAAACSGEASIHILSGDTVAPSDAGCADDACGSHGVALAFSGPYDRVEVPSSPLLDLPQDFAIEAWVMVDSYEAGHGIFNRWVAQVGDIELTFGTPELLADAELPEQAPVPSHTLATWGFVPPGQWITAHTAALPTTGVWHHIASSYGGGALKLYVDGELWATASGSDRIANPDNTVYIGATERGERPIDPRAGTQWWPPIQGWIADVRLSAGDRYPSAFVPESRLAADAATIALWHLDEGSGTTATDSGPNHLSGTIVNAKWVDAQPRGASRTRYQTKRFPTSEP